MKDSCLCINFGRDFGSWIEANISKFKSDFKRESPEGQRGTDGEAGSPFWFSSQYRRISNKSGIVKDLKVFKLEDIEYVNEYLSLITQTNIPHSNRSKHNNFLSYYNSKTLELVNGFAPLREDLEHLNYQQIS
jgi:hypothetical protein